VTRLCSDLKLRVAIVGGGVAALETALALRELAPDQTAGTVVAPNAQFVYRPMAVCEPFVFPPARPYPLAPIVRDAGAELVNDALAWVDADRHILHTKAGRELEYDALVVALGARIVARYAHAITIDDRRMAETLYMLVQDIDAGCIDSLAFLSPGRMAWPLPLYELALMIAGRAHSMGTELAATIVTPEASPLEIFGAAASDAVAALLAQAHIDTIGRAHAEVPDPGEVVVNPGDLHVRVDRVVALPELYGPCVRGIPMLSTSTRRATPPTSPSSTAASAPSRPTRWRSRSPRWLEPR
jgi:sulfide:quinone oxidoreductase